MLNAAMSTIPLCFLLKPLRHNRTNREQLNEIQINTIQCFHKCKCVKKLRGQEKQPQRLKGLILECGQDLCNHNTTGEANQKIELPSR